MPPVLIAAIATNAYDANGKQATAFKFVVLMHWYEQDGSQYVRAISQMCIKAIRLPVPIQSNKFQK